MFRKTDSNLKTSQILQKIEKSRSFHESELKIEPEILSLVNELNGLTGIITNESCGGHPEKLQLPWIRFTLDDPHGLDQLALVSVSTTTFGWLLVCEPNLAVNPDTLKIPSFLKKISFRFLLLPAAAFRNRESLPGPLITAESREQVEKEQEKISLIADFILKNRDKFEYTLEEVRKTV
ncbi:MAG: hypothetical protein PHW04_08305 [Candidatus Wallbacteria bacterium]|nr:hypothetical protein [Candidatus Wallbacteria bacterium]